MVLGLVTHLFGFLLQTSVLVSASSVCIVTAQGGNL